MQRDATTAGMALRVLGGVGVGVGLFTGIGWVILLGAVVATTGHGVYRRGKQLEEAKGTGTSEVTPTLQPPAQPDQPAP